MANSSSAALSVQNQPCPRVPRQLAATNVYLINWNGQMDTTASMHFLTAGSRKNTCAGISLNPSEAVFHALFCGWYQCSERKLNVNICYKQQKKSSIQQFRSWSLSQEEISWFFFRSGVYEHCQNMWLDN